MSQLVILIFLALAPFELTTDVSAPVANAACPGARPIAEARSLALDAQATVRGIVTVPTGAFTDGQTFAVQDASGGIYIYRKNGIGQAVAVGDDVCVTGRLTAYHGLLELTPASPQQIIRLGHSQPLAPQVSAPEAIGEATEGRLVSVTGPVSHLSSARFRVGDAAIFLEKRAGISTAELQEGCPVTVIGLSAAYDGAQVWPRAQADILPGACAAPAACAQSLTIAQIQGRGAVSAYDGQQGLSCLTGCITGVAASGFFLQSPPSDEDRGSSEGIFVYRFTGWANPRNLRAGDLVTLQAFGVQEFYGQTEIVGLGGDSDVDYRLAGRCDLPAPTPIQPLIDPTRDPVTQYEPVEGMRVTLSFDAVVTGPTTRYASRFPAGEPEIALIDRASPLDGQRIFAPSGVTSAVASLPVGRGMIYLTGGLGSDLPAVGTGDRVRAEKLTGILAYQFDRYVVLVDDPAPLGVEDAPDVIDAERPLGPNEFGICTFNLENLFDAVDDGDGDMGDWTPADTAAFRAQLDKRVLALRDDLAACTIVAVQEVEGKDAVWAALAQGIGPDFHYDYFESADVRDITVGVIYDGRRVTLRHSEPAQACTPADYGVDYAAVRGARAHLSPCDVGVYPLFDRPPYLADLTVRNAAGDRALDVRIVVNHLKSKRGDERINVPRRIAQARHVAGLLTAPNAIALGDFNDALGTETLAQFAGLVNLYEAHLPPADRYTYIFNGLAEVLDHVIMTPGLDRYFLSGGPVHINADFPEKRVPDATSHRSSDHDPVFVRFSFQPTGVRAALIGMLTGAVGGSVRR